MGMGLTACTSGGVLVAPPSQPLGTGLNSSYGDTSPDLSRTGRYVVFASDRQGNQRRIFLYDMQDRRLLDLPGLNQPGMFLDQPAISDDGRYLVYVGVQQGKSDIYLYDRQSLQRQNLTENLLGSVRSPRISGDGRWIVFEHQRQGQWDLAFFDRGPTIEPTPPGGN